MIALVETGHSASDGGCDPATKCHFAQQHGAVGCLIYSNAVADDNESVYGICKYDGDGECDDPTWCAFGAEPDDCGVMPDFLGWAYDTSCPSIRDGQCDDGYSCDRGTDSEDCEKLAPWNNVFSSVTGYTVGTAPASPAILAFALSRDVALTLLPVAGQKTPTVRMAVALEPSCLVGTDSTDCHPWVPWPYEWSTGWGVAEAASPLVYEFEARSGMSYYMRTEGGHGLLDSVLDVYNGDRVLLAHNDDVVARVANHDVELTKHASIFWTCLKTGSYFVHVAGARGNSGGFVLAIDQIVGPAQVAVDPLQAAPIAIAATLHLNLTEPRLLALDVVANASYLIAVDVPDPSDDVLVSLLDADMNTVGVGDDADSGIKNFYEAVIGYTSSTAGQMYIRVEAKRMTTLVEFAACVILVEQATAFQSQKVFGSDSATPDKFERGDRQKVYSMAVQKGKTYSIYTELKAWEGEDAGTPLLDSEIVIIAGTEGLKAFGDTARSPVLAQNDDIVRYTQKQSFVQWRCELSMTIFIMVKGYSKGRSIVQDSRQFYTHVRTYIPSTQVYADPFAFLKQDEVGRAAALDEANCTEDHSFCVQETLRLSCDSHPALGIFCPISCGRCQPTFQVSTPLNEALNALLDIPPPPPSPPVYTSHGCVCTTTSIDNDGISFEDCSLERGGWCNVAYDEELGKFEVAPKSTKHPHSACHPSEASTKRGGHGSMFGWDYCAQQAETCTDIVLGADQCPEFSGQYDCDEQMLKVAHAEGLRAEDFTTDDRLSFYCPLSCDACFCETNNDEICDEGVTCAYTTDSADCYCRYENDGVCDAGSSCPEGSDINDCTCDFLSNGVCNEGPSDGYTPSCPYGSDSEDCCLTTLDGECDERHYCPPGSDREDCYCPSANDGVCDEVTGFCPLFSDLDDCGPDTLAKASCPFLWVADGFCDEGTYCAKETDQADCAHCDACAGPSDGVCHDCIDWKSDGFQCNIHSDCRRGEYCALSSSPFVSWCTPCSAPDGVTCYDNPASVADGCDYCYRAEMCDCHDRGGSTWHFRAYDSYGDGWNDGSFFISVADDSGSGTTFIRTGTPRAAKHGNWATNLYEYPVCIFDEDACYAVEVSGLESNLYAFEATWEFLGPFESQAEKASDRDWCQTDGLLPWHVPPPPPPARCRTIDEGDPCYDDVSWAMNTGINERPEDYHGLMPGSTFEEFQCALATQDTNHPECIVPCDISCDPTMERFVRGEVIASGAAGRFVGPATGTCQALPVCGAGYHNVIVTIRPDRYPAENAWTLVDSDNNTELSMEYPLCQEGSERTMRAVGAKACATVPDSLFIRYSACVPDGNYRFAMFDAHGDGMCCENGFGGYDLTVDGVPIAAGGEFRSVDTVVFTAHGEDVGSIANESCWDDLSVATLASLINHTGTGMGNETSEADPCQVHGDCAIGFYCDLTLHCYNCGVLDADWCDIWECGYGQAMDYEAEKFQIGSQTTNRYFEIGELCDECCKSASFLVQCPPRDYPLIEEWCTESKLDCAGRCANDIQIVRNGVCDQRFNCKSLDYDYGDCTNDWAVSAFTRGIAFVYGGKPVFAILGDGSSWGLRQSGFFHSREGENPLSRTFDPCPDRRSDPNELLSKELGADWIVCNTEAGHLAFEYNGLQQLYIDRTGDVWDRAVGRLAGSKVHSPDSYDPLPSDLQILIEVGSWTLATFNGYLGWFYNCKELPCPLVQPSAGGSDVQWQYRQLLAMVVVTRKGEVWSRYTQGFLQRNASDSAIGFESFFISPSTISAEANVVVTATGSYSVWANGEELGGGHDDTKTLVFSGDCQQPLLIAAAATACGMCGATNAMRMEIKWCGQTIYSDPGGEYPLLCTAVVGNKTTSSNSAWYTETDYDARSWTDAVEQPQVSNRALSLAAKAFWTTQASCHPTCEPSSRLFCRIVVPAPSGQVPQLRLKPGVINEIIEQFSGMKPVTKAVLGLALAIVLFFMIRVLVKNRQQSKTIGVEGGLQQGLRSPGMDFEMDGSPRTPNPNSNVDHNVLAQMFDNSEAGELQNSVMHGTGDETLIIGEEIGNGAYGVVYKAQWGQAVVAVKQLKLTKQEMAVVHKVLAEFRAEVRIMGQLNHPNIVAMHGFTMFPKICIIQEYLSNGDLGTFLHDSERSAVLRTGAQHAMEIRLNMALDTAAGMQYLHGQAPTIIHRDLKSPNLLLDGNLRVKITDFGLARAKKATEGRTQIMTTCGT
jgi:hypothetical protein